MDELIAKWRRELFSGTEWQLDTYRSPAAGALSGVWLKACPEAPYGAYMKPTTYHFEAPVAAKEKIAADLAFDVGVFVAPVLLYDSSYRFGAVQNECCVSLVTHAEVAPWVLFWEDAGADSLIGAAIRGAAAERVSSLLVFDLWIDNRDRNNAGNVVYGVDRKYPGRSGFVGLDHSNSMGVGRSWSAKRWQALTFPPFPDALRQAFDQSVMIRVAERIATLPDWRVSECVQRIPDLYLRSNERSELLDGLLGRKKVIQAFVSQNA